MAIDYSTPIGQVRLLTADVDEASFLVSDSAIQGYLNLSRGPYRAAAAVLDAMATSEVLLAKVIKTQDVSTDGAKVAAELRAQATALRARADDEDAALVPDEDDFFFYVPFGGNGPLEAEERWL